MRVRFPVLVIVFLATVSACGGNGSKGSDGKSPSANESRLATSTASLTPITVPCAKFAAAQARIIAAQRQLYTPGSNAEGAVDELVDELDALKAGAPGKVKTALTDLSDGFRSAAALAKSPTPANQQKLKDLAPKLSSASQLISEYVLSQC